MAREISASSPLLAGCTRTSFMTLLSLLALVPQTSALAVGTADKRIVMKFGGSSVRDAERVTEVCRQVFATAVVHSCNENTAAMSVDTCKSISRGP